MLDLKEFKIELLEVYKDELYYIDDMQDLRRYSREQADLYSEKIDRLELFNALAKKYGLDNLNQANFSNKLSDRIDGYNYFYLEQFIFDYLKDIF